MTKAKRGLGWIGLFGLYMVTTGVVAAWTIAFLIGSREDVTVPRLTGKTQSEAEYLLSREMLGVKILGYRHSDTIPQGGVVQQTVPSEEQVRAGRTIGLYLSEGPRERVAPRVAGLSEEAALMVLRSSELRPYRAATTCSDEHARGNIVGQYPPPGNKVKGDRVALLLSSGACGNRFIMANVVGMPIETVLRDMDRRQFAARSVRADENAAGILGTVTAVDPPAGSVLQPHEFVALTVASDGPVRDRISYEHTGQLMRITIDSPPGLLRRRAMLRVDRGEWGGNYATEFLLQPGQAVERALWLPPGSEVVLEINGQETWRKAF